MSKLYTFGSIVLIFLSILTPLSSQTPTASFAPWKGNNKAAYVIIHDDYGDVTTPGIVQYADNEAFTRGIKLTFGAITSVCEPVDWTNAKNMMAHGHECINHSHNHYCAQPVTWCPSQVYTTADFQTELGLSTDLIRDNTGVAPRFFIHPYDLSTDDVINYLKSLGYLGTRAGNQEAVNSADFTDPYRLNYHVFQPTSNLAQLNAGVDAGVNSGGLVLRELHGVQDGSWATVSLANYRSHLDYVKSKMNQKLIWSATITDVLTYKMQRDAFQPVVSYAAASNTITVSFNELKTIDPSVLRTPVTVNVNLNGIVGNYEVLQGANGVAATRSGNIVSFNVYPHQGTVTLKCTDCGIITPPTDPVVGCLKASYFTNINLTGTPTVVRPESSIDYNWVSAAPIANIPADNFSVRWEGVVNPNVSGLYTFTAVGDDGVRLWVNNQLIIDKWIDQSVTTYSASISLTAGQQVPIKLEYYERGGSAEVRLNWTIPNQTSRVIAFSACPITTPPVAEFDPTACYRFIAKHSNKVLDLSSNSTANGLQLAQNTWTGANRQIWRIKPIDATYYQIVNGLSGRVVNVLNGSTADGANITQQPYSNIPQRQWKFEKNAAGQYYIRNRNSNKVLDVNNASTADNTRMIQWTKNDSYTNQQWTVQTVGCPTNIAALLTDRDITFNGNLEGNKAVLQWVVNSTDMMDYYELEKADDSHDFAHFAYINGNSTDALRAFSYVDEQLTDGHNHYRLKATATDGTIQTSEIVTLKYENPQLYAVSPNPAHDHIDVDLTPAGNRNVDIQVVSLLGTVVKQVSIEAGSHPRHRMDIDNLEAGQYIIKIQPQGQRMTVRKLVIIK
jgi:hypothetical protein